MKMERILNGAVSKYESPIVKVITIVVEGGILSASTNVNDWIDGGNLGNKELD